MARIPYGSTRAGGKYARGLTRVAAALHRPIYALTYAQAYAPKYASTYAPKYAPIYAGVRPVMT